MDLTRRDAVAALAASGIAIGAGMVVWNERRADAPDSAGHPSTTTNATPPAEFGNRERQIMVAIAEIVYPSAVSGIRPFVGAYLDGKLARQPDYADGIVAAIERLTDLSTDWYDDRFLNLDHQTQEQLLDEIGADTAEPDPDGTPAERIRYYLINELLFALYTSPTGGELIGIENPQGHPGGVASYQRGPNDDT